MITMREIDDARHALGIERETLRSLIDHHLGVVDAIERVKNAEARVEGLLRQWWDQDCMDTEPAPGYWKMQAVANKLDAKMFAKAADSEKEGQRLALAALKEAEKKIRDVPCVVEAHERRDALPQQIHDFIAKTWGSKNATDLWERSVRVVEEAIEFAQASGLTEPFVKMLLDRVYSRPIGSCTSEAAGLGVTLVAWCHARLLSLDDLMLTEVQRIETMDREKLRAKQAEKAAAGFGIEVEL